MTDQDRGHPAAAPAGWQDWQRWAEETDWTDWRSWLRRTASTDWASPPWPAVPWEQPRETPEGGISLTLRALEEDELGEHLTAVWPAFRQWWRNGANGRPTAAQTGARLDEHMPELVPAWRRLAEILDNDPEAAAALGLWNPPPRLGALRGAARGPQRRDQAGRRASSGVLRSDQAGGNCDLTDTKNGFPAQKQG
jgi:hypothetical protein